MTIAQSAKKGDALCLEYYLKHTPPSAWLFDRREGLTRAIIDCHPDAAGTLMDWLRQRAMPGSATSTYYHSIVNHAPSLAHRTKLLAVLHQAGFERCDWQIRIHLAHANLLDRMEGKCLSSHERIEMKVLEPNPENFITREWWKPFYGVRIDIWQRRVVEPCRSAFRLVSHM
jgi:hypothetical protein